jgi:hypothetical protein
MERDAVTSAQLAQLRQQLESVSGQPIAASDEQLRHLFFRVSLSSTEDGTIMSRGFFLPITKNCVQASTLGASLLDVSSSSSTDASGQRTFHLSDAICSTANSFDEPVNLVVTPNARTPCYATMTHVLVPAAPGSVLNDLQIVVSTWDANGNPAPNTSFDWRCRLLSLPIIG